MPENESLDTARTTMLQVIEDVAKQPFTQGEIDRVRAKALKSIDETINDPQRLGIALSGSIAAGDWRLFFLQRDRWRALTPADVDRVASAYFKPANRTVGEFIPDARPDRAPAPPAVDIAAMVKDYKGDPAVAAGETFDATPANLDARAQRYTLANGMKVALLPKKTRGGTVHFYLSMHYGDEASIKGREGEARLTGSMLLRGTSKHSRQEIEDTLDRLRAQPVDQRPADRADRARSDGARQSRADPGPAGRGLAASVVSRRRARYAQARADRRPRAGTHRSPRNCRAGAGAL